MFLCSCPPGPTVDLYWKTLCLLKTLCLFCCTFPKPDDACSTGEEQWPAGSLSNEASQARPVGTVGVQRSGR